MLKVENVNKFFGGLKAVNNVSLEVQKGSITGLIGPNGAGKTTLFNTIAGVYSANSGDLYLEEENIFLYSQLSFFSLTTYFILLPILEWNVTLHFFC